MGVVKITSVYMLMGMLILISLYMKTCSIALLLVIPNLVTYLMRQMIDGAKEFARFVVCRKCSLVYKLKDCKERNGKSKTCQFVSFPNHPHRRMRQPCGTILLKTVELSSKKKTTLPLPHFLLFEYQNFLADYAFKTIIC